MHRPRPRPRTLALGALALLLAVAPFVPRGADDQGAIVPSGDGKYGALGSAATAGFSELTPEMQAEIDRVVGAGRVLGRMSGKRASGKQSPDQLAADVVRCAEFEGQRYCLGTGWTDDTEEQVQARTVAAARSLAARPGATTRATGDLDARALLARAARLSPAARAAADRAELTMAARSVAKVWLLRHELEGVRLPANFLAEHPEARAATSPGTASRTATPSPTTSTATAGTATTSTMAAKTVRDYPRRWAVLDKTEVSAQSRTYWCGPTTMQMIVWGWRDRRQSQRHWADRLHTTTGGTGIYDMVRVVNERTGWDRPSHAGPYIALDIKDYSFKQWMLLIMRHIHDYRAPVVLHPVLQKQFYPYLDDDASGHFQVGRGYDKHGKRPDEISYFEPWNQQRFDPSEPYIARVQWRSAYQSYRANQAHFQHNIGV